MTHPVRKQSDAAAELNEHCALIDALMGGTSKMRKKPELMPKWPVEEDASYKVRLSVATLFPAYQRTIEVLGAKPFSKPVTYGDDVPEKIKELCENVDRQGRNLHSFLSEVGNEALGYGISGILVDYPATKDKDGNALYATKAEEDKARVRPYFVQIHPRSILGWLTDENGLSQLRILECVEVPNGDFDVKFIEQVRVLRRGSWETWRKNEGSTKEDDWSVYASGQVSLTDIPFVPVFGKRIGFMQAIPPLLDLAYANVEHWQTKSDRQTALHILSVPFLFTKMIDAAKLVAGAGYAITANDPNADMKYVETTGVAVEKGRQVLLDLEDQMRQAGAELLIVKSAKITEAQTQADNEQGSCVLQKVAQNIEDSGDQALQFMADFIGEPEGGHITIWKDFGAASLAEAGAELLFKSVSAGYVSGESYFLELQRRGILSPDLEWDEEVARIAQQGPALGTM